MLAVLVGMNGCATGSGWSLDDRVCQATDAPRVCLDAEPDAPISMRVGGARIVPGECAVAPEDGDGGRLSLIVEDGRNHRTRQRRIGVRRRKSVTVTVSLREREDPAVSVDRVRCDAAGD